MGALLASSSSTPADDRVRLTIPSSTVRTCRRIRWSRRVGHSARPRRRGTPDMCCSPRSAAPGRNGSPQRACSSSAPAGSARPPCSTSPLRASARSVSSTPTSSTSRTCTVRSSTPTPTSADPRRSRRRRPCIGSTRTSTVDAPRPRTRLVQRARDHRAATTSSSTAPTTSRPATSSTTLRHARQAARLGLDPALRRPGLGVVGGPRALLPLRLPRAAAARVGAELRRGWGAGRAVRGHRLGPVHRGDQAAPRHR